MRCFCILVRIGRRKISYKGVFASSAQAALDAIAKFGDEPMSVSVRLA